MTRANPWCGAMRLFLDHSTEICCPGDIRGDLERWTGWHHPKGLGERNEAVIGQIQPDEVVWTLLTVREERV